MAPPAEVYRHPRTRVRGRLRRQPADEFPDAAGGRRRGAAGRSDPDAAAPAQTARVVLGVRPEDLELVAEGGFGLRVQVVEPLGSHTAADRRSRRRSACASSIPPDRAVRAGETVLHLRPHAGAYRLDGCRRAGSRWRHEAWI